MPFVSKQNVFDKARILLGDSEVAGGQVYTDDGANGTVNLNSLLGTVHSEAYRVMERYELPYTRRHFHASLDPYQSFFDPAAVSVSDVGDIEEIRQRAIAWTRAIAAVTPDVANSTCRVQTSAPHGLSNGDNIMILPTVGGITGLLGEWTIAVASDDEFDIPGCRATGSFTSGGTVIVPSGAWSPIEQVDPPLDLESSRNSFTWEGDILRFSPSTQARLIKATYQISGTLPAQDTDTIAPDDWSDFYAYRLAALAADANGDYETADRRNYEAHGGDPENPGGFLGQLVGNAVKASNNVIRQFPRRGFRQPRKSFDYAIVRR